MRKGLLIGAIVLVVIGVAAYFFSQPKEGTVEWHKMRIEHRNRQLMGGTLHAMVIRVLNPRAVINVRQIDSLEQLDADYEALFRLGFLVTKNYRFTNSPQNIDASRIGQVSMALPEKSGCFSAFGIADGVLFVVAPVRDIPIWEKFIAAEDSPPK